MSLLLLAIATLSFLPLNGVAAAPMDDDELLGLFQVMGSLLDDPSWAQTHPFPCTDTPWPGVECELLEDTSIFHVTKIHIGQDIIIPPCKRSAQFPSALPKLPFLKTLSLINCFTVSPISLPFSLFLSLSSLEHLTLESNPALSGEIPPTISNLCALKILALSQNNLIGKIPYQIGTLITLQHLDLSHNKLSGAIPPQIGNLISLSILDLSYNSLQQNLPSSIGQMHSLEKIDFSSNKFQGSLPPNLGDLRNLVLLDLSLNSISGPIPENLSNLNQLQYLMMEGNPVNSRFPSFLNSLPQIRVISLSGCGLTGPIPSPFPNLTKLTALSLDNNNLEGGVPSELGLLPNLGALNLSGNLLTGRLLFPEEFVKRMGERLDVRENRGLCSNQELRSSRFVRNASASSSCLSGDGKNASVGDGDDQKMKPNLYGDDERSNGHDSAENISFFSGLVLVFLLFSLSSLI